MEIGIPYKSVYIKSYELVIFLSLIWWDSRPFVKFKWCNMSSVTYKLKIIWSYKYNMLIMKMEILRYLMMKMYWLKSTEGIVTINCNNLMKCFNMWYGESLLLIINGFEYATKWLKLQNIVRCLKYF